MKVSFPQADAQSAGRRRSASTCQEYESIGKSKIGSFPNHDLNFDADIDIIFVEDGHPVPPSPQNAAFKVELQHSLLQLLEWCQENGFKPTGLDALEIDVSIDFKISKSLVPAWFGHRGYMEFPFWRVNARRAAVMHELVHVFLPNANQFLAEGLAVALQASLGKNPAFPNFGCPLHDVARERFAAIANTLQNGETASLAVVKIDELDRIATPGPLVLTVGGRLFGEDPLGQSHVYPLAGSFVEFLLDIYGPARFCALYALTPLVPFQQNAGRAGRWVGIYGQPLTALRDEWRAMLLRRPPAPRQSRRRETSNSRQTNSRSRRPIKSATAITP